MVFDATDGYLLYFDMYANYAWGPPPGCALHELWSFVHGSWRELTDGSELPPYGDVLLAYDAAGGYVVLLGGCFPTSNQTWIYAGGVWTYISSGVAPPSGGGGGLVYDPSIGAVVLFESYVCSANCSPPYHPVSVTWEFRQGTWQNVTSTVEPPPNAEYGMAYDPSSGSLVLAGGTGPCVPSGTAPSTCSTSLNTWTFTGGTWENVSGRAGPPARGEPGFSEDVAIDGAVLFGGSRESLCPVADCSFNDTWRFSDGAWQELAVSGPPERSDPAIAYDPIGDYLVMQGGFGAGLLNDTWILNGTLPTPPPAAPGITEQGAVLLGIATGGLAVFGAVVVLRIRRR